MLDFGYEYFENEKAFEKRMAKPDLSASYAEMLAYLRKYELASYRTIKNVIEPVTEVEYVKACHDGATVIYDYTAGGYRESHEESINIQVKFHGFKTEVQFQCVWSQSQKEWVPNVLGQFRHKTDSCHICKRFKRYGYEDGKARKPMKDSCILGLLDAKRILKEAIALNADLFLRLAPDSKVKTAG